MISGKQQTRPGDSAGIDERAEFQSYVRGILLALVMTGLSFGLVHWSPITGFALHAVIGAAALAQMIVHLRYFLHIGFRQPREDLQLILFSSLLLVIMFAGTLWIMANLTERMALPVVP